MPQAVWASRPGSLRFSAIRKKSSSWQNSSDENLDERAMICTVRRFLSSLPTKKKIHTVWKTMHVPWKTSFWLHIPSESVLSGSISSAHSVMILKSVLCLMSLKFLPIMSYTEWLLWDIRQTRPKRKSTKSERSGLSNKTDRRFYR